MGTLISNSICIFSRRSTLPCHSALRVVIKVHGQRVLKTILKQIHSLCAIFLSFQSSCLLVVLHLLLRPRGVAKNNMKRTSGDSGVKKLEIFSILFINSINSKKRR